MPKKVQLFHVLCETQYSLAALGLQEVLPPYGWAIGSSEIHSLTMKAKALAHSMRWNREGQGSPYLASTGSVSSGTLSIVASSHIHKGLRKHPVRNLTTKI